MHFQTANPLFESDDSISSSHLILCAQHVVLHNALQQNEVLQDTVERYAHFLQKDKRHVMLSVDPLNQRSYALFPKHMAQ